MSPRRRTVAGMRRDSAGIRDDAVVLRSSDVAGMRRWTRLRRQQVVLSEKAVQRGTVDPKRLGHKGQAWKPGDRRLFGRRSVNRHAIKNHEFSDKARAPPRSANKWILTPDSEPGHDAPPSGSRP